MTFDNPACDWTISLAHLVNVVVIYVSVEIILDIVQPAACLTEDT